MFLVSVVVIRVIVQEMRGIQIFFKLVIAVKDLLRQVMQPDGSNYYVSEKIRTRMSEKLLPLLHAVKLQKRMTKNITQV